ncbi:hypothetical protein [Bacillus cereus]|uniref:hypothetical protein n=1 Tax=Bacillus cereus TaxID=1396 RepID=UPI001595B2FC|nr:hypothetical protein [Bacillus cereus]
MSEVYSKCTVCYKELTQEDEEFNMQVENLNFPICISCLEETAHKIEKAIKK